MPAKKKTEAPAVVLAPIARIKPHPDNPRQHESKESLKELARSIEEVGLLSPLTVRSVGKGAKATYQIVAGHRRYEACKLAGIKEVPVILRTLEDDEALIVQIVENLHREDLTTLEEAIGFQRLVDEHGLKAEDIAARCGKSKSYVYGRLKVLELTTPNRKALEEGNLEPSVAVMLARIKDPDTQNEAAEELVGTIDMPPATVDQAKHTLKAYQRDLRQAGFPRDDPDSPGGPCNDCAFRDGNVCTKPACYADNRKHANEAKLAKAAKKGEKISKRDLAHEWRYVDLSKAVGWDLGGSERIKDSWGKLIREKGVELETHVSVDKDDKVRRYVLRDAAKEALADAGHEAAQKTVKSEKASKAHDKRSQSIRKNEDEVARAIIADVRQAWDESLKGTLSTADAVAWRLVLDLLFEVADYQGVEACPPKRDKLPAHQVPGAVVGMLLADTIDRGNIEGKAVKAVLADSDTNLRAIVKEVEAKLAEEKADAKGAK